MLWPPSLKYYFQCTLKKLGFKYISAFKSLALLVLSQVIELFDGADVLDICLFIDITGVLHILVKISSLLSNLDPFVNW